MAPLNKMVARSAGHEGTSVIYGGGHNGQMVLRKLKHNPTLGFRAIGFIDDDPSLRKRTVSEVPVLGTSRDIPAILDEQLVSTLIVSSQTIEPGRLSEVIQACNARGVTMLQAGFQIHPLGSDAELCAEQAVSPDPAGQTHIV